LSFSIAVAGKGGSGKTSLSSLIIRYLKKHKLAPILAVDADPNANLGESLGLKVKETVGLMLDNFQKAKMEIPAGMTKEAYLEFKLNSLMVETPGLDLISMGHGEGTDCYCYPNLILRKFIDRLSESYAYVVMDNEAGMEHLSRGTTQDVDELLIVSNHSIKGIRTLARIKELVVELKLRVKHQSIVIGMAPPQVDQSIFDELAKLGLKADAIIPQDEQKSNLIWKMKPLLELADSSKACKAVDVLMASVLKAKVEGSRQIIPVLIKVTDRLKGGNNICQHKLSGYRNRQRNSRRTETRSSPTKIEDNLIPVWRQSWSVMTLRPKSM
jgi:CO dehydrogenase maturation factor